MDINKNLINVTEYCNPPYIVEVPFNQEEIEILESNEFKQKVKIFRDFAGRQILETQQYVGYIIVENHVISITPKIPKISFLNMIKYALNLPELNISIFEASEEKNYYDFLVLFLLLETEKLLQRGLITGYQNFEDNLNRLRGKILFEKNIINNFDRNDKLCCSFSEMSQDVKENQIIKYTLFYLSRCIFLDDSINVKLAGYYNRLNHISPIPITSIVFESIEYTPLNHHYKHILTLCELFLRDSSINDQNIGVITGNSFLIDMNLLFEKFVVNLIRERLTDYEVEEQKKTFADLDKMLESRLDILLSHNHQPVIILDTKYKEFEGKPESNDVNQLISYSISTDVKDCGLIYSANKISYRHYNLHQGIKLHIILFDLIASNQFEFESKCSNFMNCLLKIIMSVKEYVK